MKKNIFAASFLFGLSLCAHAHEGYHHFTQMEILEASLKADPNKLKSQLNPQNSNDVRKYSEMIISDIIKEYKTNTPMVVRVHDNSDPSINHFFSQTARTELNPYMAALYFPQMKVNGKTSAFCLIHYNSKQRNAFDEYMRQNHYKGLDGFKIVIWHEIGHCLSSNMGNKFDPKTEEFFADAFAISQALNQDNPDLAITTIAERKKQNPQSVHANADRLQQYLDLVVKQKVFKQRLNINQITTLVKDYIETGQLNRSIFISEKEIIKPIKKKKWFWQK